MNKNRSALPAILALLVLTVPIRGQTNPDGRKDDQVGKKETSTEKEKPAGKKSGKKDDAGLIIESADGKHRLQMAGYIQLDSRSYYQEEAYIPASRSDTDPTYLSRDFDPLREMALLPYQVRYKPNPYENKNTFLMRRVRLVFVGSVFEFIDFRVMGAFDQGKAALFDSYIDLNFHPALRIRGGKFKAPVSLERLQQAVALPFVERGLPNLLAPNRDVGIMLFGNLGGRTFEYNLALLNGSVDYGQEDTDEDAYKELALRLFAHPFNSAKSNLLQDLGIGIAVTHGIKKGTLTETNLPNYKNLGQDRKFFSYITDTANPERTPVANGLHYRVYPQMYYYYGPFGLMAQYAVSAQTVSRNLATVPNTSEPCLPTTAYFGHFCRETSLLKHSAWETGVTYVLTGERATYKGVVPRQPFEPQGGGWGAFEIHFRYGQFFVDGDAFLIQRSGADARKKYADPAKSASRVNSYTVGAQWYLNDHFKLVLDYSVMKFAGIDDYKPIRDDHKINPKFNDEKIVFVRASLKW